MSTSSATQPVTKREPAPAEIALPPGPPARGTGLLGTVRYGLSFFLDPFGFVGGRFERYGDIYHAPSGGVGLYVVKDPDHVRDVLVTRSDDFEKTHTAFESLSEVLGQGLLTSDGDVWRRHRRLLGPAFGKKAIEGYVSGMVREAEGSVARLKDGERRDMAAEMTDLTLRIVGRTLLGIDVSREVGRVARAMSTFQTSLALPRSFPALVRRPLAVRSQRARADLDALILRVIEERRASGKATPDLLQMLLDATDPENPGDRLSSKEIQDELVTFLLAGHETTSNTLAWALHLVSRHPEVERALTEELDRVLGGRLPGPEDIDKLGLADRIIKESMRLYPPAYVLARRAARETRIGQYTVPRGSEVVVWIYFTHRDPRYFPDPEAFKPERFEEAEEARRPRQAYVPFGAGPRACIGRAFAQIEATVLLACLYQRFVFRPADGKPVKARPRITLSPAGGLPMIPRLRAGR